MNPQEIFAQRLNDLMVDRDITGKALAASAQITENSISGYLGKGKRSVEPKIGALVKIAKTLNVSTDYLLGGTQIKSTNPNIASICEYTGLSEKSVEVLRGFQQRRKKERAVDCLMATINALIEYEDEQHYFSAALEVISAILFASHETDDAVISVDLHGRVNVENRDSYENGTAPVLYKDTIKNTLRRSMEEQLHLTLDNLRIAVNPNAANEFEKQLHEILTKTNQAGKDGDSNG